MDTTGTIRPAVSGDKASILALAETIGLVSGGELEQLDGMLTEYFDGDQDDGHHWIVDDEGGVAGAAYYAPEMMTVGTWNLYFIAVRPDLQGNGRGSALLRHVERHLKHRGERILIIETSGTGSFDRTRAFYRKHGYDEEARIRDFYASGDDKIVFRKAL